VLFWVFSNLALALEQTGQGCFDWWGFVCVELSTCTPDRDDPNPYAFVDVVTKKETITVIHSHMSLPGGRVVELKQ